MIKRFRNIIIYLVCINFFVLPNVQAGYQSIPGASTETKDAYNWIREVRKLEAPGNGMGLGENYDSSTLLSTTEANNIDVHMIKNTEWGAMAIFSASNYGKQGSGESRYVHKTTGDQLATTTGNKYGVCSIANTFVAAEGYTNLFSGVNAQYYNKYDVYSPYPNNTNHLGDAMTETTSGESTSASTSASNIEKRNRTTYKIWHYTSYSSTWFKIYSKSESYSYGDNTDYYYFGLCRGAGSIFGYNSAMGRNDVIQNSKYTSATTCGTRAVVVSGNGF